MSHSTHPDSEDLLAIQIYVRCGIEPVAGSAESKLLSLMIRQILPIQRKQPHTKGDSCYELDCERY